MIEFREKLYPTHAARVRPYFGELSVPPFLRGDRLLQDRPHTTSSQVTHRRAPISDTIDTVLMAPHTPKKTPSAVATPGPLYSISVSTLRTFDVDADSVFLTVTKAIKDHSSLFEADEKSFTIATRCEIDFLVKKAVTSTPLYRVPHDVELQTLKWLLELKTSSEDKSAKQHRARLVSA